MAPSPTGFFHWGTARAAVFNWLFARGEGGIFVVRIEDTDKERSDRKFEQDIFEGLRWLGMLWDEGPVSPDTLENKEVGNYGPYRQSERTEIYKEYLEKLLEDKKVYYCYCTKEELAAEREGMIASGTVPKYSGHCRNLEHPPKDREPQVVRLKAPEAIIEFKDIIRGTISFDASLLGDFPIARNTNDVLFHFAVVVDDHLMKITHVIRGEDHISNTPKHILILRALGFDEPLYAHVPLVLGQNREKLSKRYLTSSLLEYRDKGYLPEALVNFVAFLGWHPKDDAEVLTPQEIIERFDLKRVQKGGAIFNEEKLLWLNTQHIRRLTPEDLERRLRIYLAEHRGGLLHIPDETFSQLVLLEQPRMKTLHDFFESTEFFFKLENYAGALLIPKDQNKDDTLTILRELKTVMSELPESLDRTVIASKIAPLIDQWGRGGVLWPFRVALSGKAASPDPLDILEVLGKDATEKRLTIAINKLNEPN